MGGNLAKPHPTAAIVPVCITAKLQPYKKPYQFPIRFLDVHILPTLLEHRAQLAITHGGNHRNGARDT
jgi:hypothetical protein